MKKKTEILTPSRRSKLQQEAVEKTMLLGALVLTDFYEWKDEDILKWWEKLSHYSDIVRTPECAIKMEYVCELLQKNGIPIHWRW